MDDKIMCGQNEVQYASAAYSRQTAVVGNVMNKAEILDAIILFNESASSEQDKFPQKRAAAEKVLRMMFTAGVFHGHCSKGLSLVLLLASFAAAIPISAEMLFMKSFKVRYVCEVASGTSMIYTLARVLIYAGCLSIILVCASIIFGKRGVLLACIFILVEGPYILLCFALEISYSTLFGAGLSIPQDVDTFITWLKFLFPILSPITILCWCSDISASVKELFLCRSYDPPMIGPNISGYRGMGAAKGFVTLLATTDGLPLKLRTSRPASTMANILSHPMTSPT
ncbi:unnamed protein product [Haemonchus placei]|uniref:Vesicle transport protein n=1 Tax=Haemonchus placei TaxID=6290 RepID=A0A0N4WPD4_HAEPC|nr:unnamed protein product [Haemonchus placei]